ncbi:MAG: TMEM175 family protein [Ginsengibacter sp.]
MREPKHDKERQDFQLERFTFFTDGVCAICITLLIIEIRVPDMAVPTDALLWKSLSHMSLRFLGFVISFGIVGHYWSVHHRIFGYVVKYTTGLLWLNLAFLFTVVLLPFSSGFLGEYSSYTDLKIPYAVYTFNMCLTGFMNCWLWLYVSNPKRKMLSRIISPSRIRLGLYRSLVIPVVFIISFLISLVLPVFSKLILLLIPVILHWGMNGLEKKAEKDELNPGKINPKSTISVPKLPA